MMEEDKTYKNNTLTDDSIDLKELFSILWGVRKLIISIAVVFAFFSVLYSLSLTDQYRSEAVLTLTDGSSEIRSLSQFTN